MSNIRVDVGYTIKDGSELKFRSPVDCSAITGLIVYYPGENGNTTSKVFALADAHGNNVGNIDHLFAENVVVKVILDVTTSMAFVQNADTNAYLEAQLASKRPNTWTPTAEEVGARPDTWLPTIEEIGAAPAGYGLGGGSIWKDTKTWNGSGFFRTAVDTPNGGQIFGYQVDLWGDGLYRELYGTYVADTHRSRLHRTDINGAIGEWEWENPPMVPGVEYRTTERLNGNPVYTKLVSTGEFFGTFTTPIGDGYKTLIRATAWAKYTTSNHALKVADSALVPYEQNWINYLQFIAGENAVESGYIQLWYY